MDGRPGRGDRRWRRRRLSPRAVLRPGTAVAAFCSGARPNLRAPGTALLRPLRVSVIGVPSTSQRPVVTAEPAATRPASPSTPAISYQPPTVYPPRVGTFAGWQGTCGPCPRTRPGAGSIVYQPVNTKKRGKP